MASLFVKPAKKLQAQIRIPGDKSISHRAVMIGAVAKGETIINNFLPSADCLATIECFRKMGIDIQMTNECRIIIKGRGLSGLKQPKEILDVGNSGTTIRLISGIIAGQNYEVNITGDASIQRRPMGRIASPLREMGASIEGRIVNNEIYAPLKIFGGNLKAIEYELPVASAQVKSAVLLAGLFAEGDTVVIEKVPSRDHTERMLEHFGAEILRGSKGVRVLGKVGFDGAEVDIPGDISSAAFFMVAGIIMPNAESLDGTRDKCRMSNVGINPTRDGIIEVLHRMGANIEIKDEVILSEEPRATIIAKSSKLSAIEIGGEIVPRIIDEIPVIAVAATQAKGKTVIRGAKELRIKESDRIKTIASELRKFGAKIEELEDGMIIEGPTKLKGATVQSYGDHRIAMAMAIAGLAAEGETIIEDTECIETSFPGFEEIIRKIAQ